MSRMVSLLRNVTRRSDQGVSPSDAAPALPAAPQQYVSASASRTGSDIDKRRALWGIVKGRGSGLADGRVLVPGGGLNLFGRIFRWFELQAFMESCAIARQQSDGRVLIDPRLANNTIVTLGLNATIVFPTGYDLGDARPGLLNPSELEMSQFGVASRRARIQPHTVWIFHNGHSIGNPLPNGEVPDAFVGAIAPSGASVPAETQGVTGFTAVHVNNPATTSAIPWRITGFTSWDG